MLHKKMPIIWFPVLPQFHYSNNFIVLYDENI